jgi:uncharacterized protein
MAHPMANKTFMVVYSYPPDMLERRQPHRAEHLAHLQRGVDEGRLLLAGAFADPVDGGLLVVEAEDQGQILGWVASDPYAKAGLLRGVSIREITVAARRG